MMTPPMWEGTSQSRPDGLKTSRAPDAMDWQAIVDCVVKMQCDIRDLQARFQMLLNELAGQPFHTLALQQQATAYSVKHRFLPSFLSLRQTIVANTIRHRPQSQTLDIHQAVSFELVHAEKLGHTLQLSQSTTVTRVRNQRVSQTLQITANLGKGKVSHADSVPK